MKRRLKVHKEGYAILFSLLTLLVAVNVIVFIQSPNRILSVVCLIISILAYSFFLYFFRNPTREIEINDENLVIAPADGHIVVTEPTEEWEYFDGKKMIQVSIFMNVFSVHANWYPIRVLCVMCVITMVAMWQHFCRSHRTKMSVRLW